MPIELLAIVVQLVGGRVCIPDDVFQKMFEKYDINIEYSEDEFQVIISTEPF